MGRRVVSLFIIALIITAPAFAAWGDAMTVNGTGTLNPFSRLFDFLEQLFVGVAAGALVGAKFIIDIVKAYYRSDESPEAMKKAIMRFFLTIMIVLTAYGAIIWITTG